VVASRASARAIYLRDSLYYGRTVRRRIRIVTEEELSGLPAPVRRYLMYAGVVGKEKAQTARISFEGEFRMRTGGKWMHVETEQTSFLDDAVRVFYIKGRYLGVVPVSGRDLYARGEGNMLIKLLSFLTIENASGPEMNQSGLVTFLNDMVMIPTAFLDERVAWSAIDDRSARATLSDRGMSVSAVIHFNESGEIVNFVTEDRYHSEGGGRSRNVKWSTPFGNYREITGVRVPTEGEALWHFDEGDFCYARFRLKDLRYDAFE